MTRRPQTAFTLIELLVILALITLLLGALQPAFDRGNGGSGAAVCLNNQRAIGQAAYMYAADHSDFLPRGIMGFSGRAEYNIFVTALLPYTGFEGDAERLWDGLFSGSPSPRDQRHLRRALRQVGVGDVWQCPDSPDEAHDLAGTYGSDPGGIAIDTSLLDYVASAFPIPYTEDNFQRDLANNRPPDADARVEGSIDDADTLSRLAEIEAWKNPAETIYVSEAHVQMWWNDFRLHHTFLMSQLPFGVHPRIANDRRHPAGINAMFFDGHARAMPLHVMDSGWPNLIEDRLRWFTFVPPEFQ